MQTSAVYDQIPVVKATGSGSTTLSAFHDALVQADIAVYNLVRLSSVIPPSTVVDPSGKGPVPQGAWGDKLYCVYAEQYATEPGEQAWAGIGWVQRLDGQGGLFVEHEGTSEGYVIQAIKNSLRDVIRGHEEAFTDPDFVVHGAVCESDPVCALVVAPYETATWAGAPRG